MVSTRTTSESPVSAEEYLDRYAEHYYEWAMGEIEKLSPVSEAHDLLTAYLRQLLDAYFALNPIGRVRAQPFVMRLETLQVYREPDLQVILSSNPGQLTKTGMIGPADICIEVVSPESLERDYGRKFGEYERGGVGEYWIIDPVRRDARFCRLQSSKLYTSVLPDQQGSYQTPLLPKFALQVPTLWQEPLPDIVAAVQAVEKMLRA